MSRAEPCIGSTGIGSFSGEVDGDGDDDGIDCATPRKKSNMYCNDAGSYCEEKGYISNVNRWVAQYDKKHEPLTSGRTSTGYTSPSWNEFIWPSGSKPFGKSDKRTNSGRVNNSSRESVNRVPLKQMLASNP